MLCVFQIGIDYDAREAWNDMQKVVHGAGELCKEEYLRDCWSAVDLHPQVGG